MSGADGERAGHVFLCVPGDGAQVPADVGLPRNHAAERVPGLRAGTRTELGQSELEDDTGWDSAGEDVVDGFVDLVDLAVDGDHRGPAGGVQGEDITEVVAGADD